MTTDIASLSMEFSANGAKESVRDMRNVEAQAGKTEAATKKMETATGQMGVSFKANGNILQQAGYQVGDFAVQVASGQSALVAFTQQGAQLAGAFGPGGAVLGAVIAIGGAIGGVLFKSLMSGKKATDLLTESMKRLESVVSESNGVTGLTKELQELARTSEVIAKGRIVSAMAATEDASKHAAKSIIDEFNKVIDLFGLMKFSTVLKADAFTYKTSNVFQTIQDDLKLTGEAGEKAANDIFFALRDINTKPTADNFKKLEEILTGASTTFAKDSKKLQKLIYDISKPFDEVRKASEVVESLKKSLAEGVDTNKPISAIDKLVTKLKAQADTVGLSSIQMIEYNRQLDLKSAREKTATIDQIKSINTSYDVLHAHERGVIALKEEEEATEKARQEQLKYERSLKGVADRLDQSGAAQRKYIADMELLNTALSSAVGTTDKQYYKDLIAMLKVEYAEAGAKASEQFMKPFVGVAERLGNEIQDSIASKDWKNLGKTLGSTLGDIIGKTVSDGIAKHIGKSLDSDSGALSKIGGAFASAFGGAVIGGAIEIAISEAEKFLSDYYDPTERLQAINGTGTVLGSINEKSLSIVRAVEGSEKGIGQLIGVNQAMLAALLTATQGIQDASAYIARGNSRVNIPLPTNSSFSTELNQGLIDATLFSYFGPIGSFIDDIFGISSALGAKVKKVDEGIRILGDSYLNVIEEVRVQSYQTTRKKKHALYDYDNSTSYKDLGSDIGNQFSLIYKSIADTIIASAEVLNLDGEGAIARSSILDKKISLEGLNAEEQTKELEAYFSVVFDEIATATVYWLEEYQRAGEGAGETLVRLANEVLVVSESANRLGLAFKGVGEGAIIMSERLLDLTGGMESFIGSMNGFIDNFAPEARKFEILQNDLTSALAMTGLELPATRDGYYELLQAQKIGVQSGAENIATLLNVQAVANEYYTQLEDSATEAMKKQEEAQREAYNRQVNAYEAVRGAINGLYSDSVAFQEMQRDQAEMLLGDMVRSGVITYGETFNDALRTVTNINVDEFSTMNDFIREQSSVGSLLSDLESIAIKGSTIEEDTLAAITSGNSGIIKGLSQINQTLGGHSSPIPSPIIPRSPSASTANKNKSENDPDELLILTRSIVQNTAKSTKLLSKFDKDGIPTI